MTVRELNLVAPLPDLGTAMRITETTGSSQDRSGAVSRLIGDRLLAGDVDSAIGRSTLPTAVMPGTRTSTTATRTTTTRATSSVRAPSADPLQRHHADITFEELAQAYFDCRQHKRNTRSALEFELHLERNLYDLYQDLLQGTYSPGRSVCFIITRPKPREVWAADFRDRIVHHLFYNRISPRFYRSFIPDSCACIPGRGTLYAARRLESKVRSITQNWSRTAYYLKLDLANFFVAIDKGLLYKLICKRVTEPWWRWLAGAILFHDPRQNYELRGNPSKRHLVPPHKQLTQQPPELGLPIGNLSSQFFANIYLDVLDQFVKHQVRCRHYIRYVDDFVLLHHSPAWLNQAREEIEACLQQDLHARINPKKTILQPIERGIDFAGQVIKPWRRILRKRTRNNAYRRVACMHEAALFETANSYFGLFRQTTHSHRDRVRLANLLRHRGKTINQPLTQTYRRKSHDPR